MTCSLLHARLGCLRVKTKKLKSYEASNTYQVVLENKHVVHVSKSDVHYNYSNIRDRIHNSTPLKQTESDKTIF